MAGVGAANSCLRVGLVVRGLGERGGEPRKREFIFTFFSGLSPVNELASGQGVASRVTALDSLPLCICQNKTLSLS